jgi:hypothetical protein
VTFVSSQIKVFQRFPQVTRAVEVMAKEGLEAAAVEAAAVAQAGASIDLEVEVVPVHGDVNGYSAGIKSRKKSSQTRGGNPNATPIAWFFDRGTLGNRTRRLKRPRKESWTSSRGGTTYTAHRGDVAGKGIKPERFFGKARTVGRAKLLERIQRI